MDHVWWSSFSVFIVIGNTVFWCSQKVNIKVRWFPLSAQEGVSVLLNLSWPWYQIARLFECFVVAIVFIYSDSDREWLLSHWIFSVTIFSETGVCECVQTFLYPFYYPLLQHLKLFTKLLNKSMTYYLRLCLERVVSSWKEWVTCLSGCTVLLSITLIIIYLLFNIVYIKRKNVSIWWWRRDSAVSYHFLSIFHAEKKKSSLVPTTTRPDFMCNLPLS